MTKNKKTKNLKADRMANDSIFDINNPPLGPLDIDNISPDHDVVVMLETKRLVPNPNQSRKHFDSESIRELAESIRKHGLLQPITVRKVEGKYKIIAGERRYMASLEAELYFVPCIIKNVDEAEAFKISLIENLQREDLDPIEEANGYKHFQDKYGMTHEDIAKAVNKKQSTISEIMSLNKLPETIRSNYRLADISRTHLIEIAKADSEKTMHELIELAQKNKLSAKDIRAAKKKMESRMRMELKNTSIYMSLVKEINSLNKVLAKLFSIEPDSIPEDDRLRLIKILEDTAEKTRETIITLRLQE